MKSQIRILTLIALVCGAFGMQAADFEPARSDSKIAREEAQRLLNERNEARPKAEAAEQKLRDSGRGPEALGFDKAKALRDAQAVAGDTATAYDRYAKTAKEIGMHFRLRLPYEIRQLYCKKCKMLIVPGRTSRVRVGRSGTRAVRITCFRCGHIYRRILPANKDL